MHTLVLFRFLDKAVYEKETRYMHFKLISKLIDESTLFLYIDRSLCFTMRYLASTWASIQQRDI